MTRFILLLCAALLLSAPVLAQTPAAPGQEAPPALLPAAEALRAGANSGGAGVVALLTGKAFPATLPSAQIDGSFHFVDLVDAQGKPGTYASRGQTVPMAGETFLVTYAVPLTVALKYPARPQPDTTATLVLINLRFVQAILNIRDVPPAPPAVTDTPLARAPGRNR